MRGCLVVQYRSNDGSFIIPIRISIPMKAFMSSVVTGVHGLGCWLRFCLHLAAYRLVSSISSIMWRQTSLVKYREKSWYLQALVSTGTYGPGTRVLGHNTGKSNCCTHASVFYSTSSRCSRCSRGPTTLARPRPLWVGGGDGPLAPPQPRLTLRFSAGWGVRAVCIRVCVRGGGGGKEDQCDGVCEGGRGQLTTQE